jgi:hypothetical protein
MPSAFLSDSIRTLAAGGTFTFPVAAEGKSWWMSRGQRTRTVQRRIDGTLDARVQRALD